MAKKKKLTKEIEEMSAESAKKPKIGNEEENELKVITNGNKLKEEVDNKEESDSESTSDSDSDDETSNKKSSSDSDSDSDDSDDEEDSAEKNEEKGKEDAKDDAGAPLTQINCITNSSPVKRYPVAEKSSSSDSYHSDTEEEDKKRRKKQKKMEQLQLTRKIKRTLARKKDFFGDLDKDEEDENLQNSDDMPDWPEADFSELLQRIETQLPLKDNLKFDSRAAKLNWSQIQFKSYSAAECYDVWNRITKRIRRFRTLRDMLLDAKDWVTKPWTNFYRGQKKNRHPDMPTRPLSTYMIYYLDHKDKIASENPGMEMTQISKIISEMYKHSSQEERDKYAEMAAKQRQNFEIKLSEFYKDHPEMASNAQNKATLKERESKGPKKPSGPFKLFFEDQLKAYGQEGIFDRKVVEEAAKEKWKALGDKKKLVWINWALDDLKRYENELKNYKIDHPDFVPPAIVKSFLNKDERIIKERLAGKPLKPPNSAYSLFSRLMLQSDEDVKSIPPKLRMAEVSRKWKVLTDEQKMRYEEQVRELQEQYKLEFASYLESLPADERAEELKKTQPKRRNASSTEDGSSSTPAAAKKAKNRAARRRTATRSRQSTTRRQLTSAALGGRPSTRSATRAKSSTSESKKEEEEMELYMGEPAPPPVRVYDLFLKTFLEERPAGTSEDMRLKEAPRYWEILSDAKKGHYRQKLTELKQKYIVDYEIFLKSLSPEQLKEFSQLKNKAKQREEAQEHLEQINGTLSDSNEESESEAKYESSTHSDSDSKSDNSDSDSDN